MSLCLTMCLFFFSKKLDVAHFQLLILRLLFLIAGYVAYAKYQ